jgi:hypothetical protein
MKKIIALALALIMVLSMGVVALAADHEYQPGEAYTIDGYTGLSAEQKANLKVSYDFTSAYVKDADGNRVETNYRGAAMIESLAWVKVIDDEGVRTYDLTLTLKEALTSTTAKEIYGVVKVYDKTTKETTPVEFGAAEDVEVGNDVVYVDGSKKAADATPIDEAMAINVVMYAEDGAGFVTFTDAQESLTGVVKMENDEKAQVYFDELTEDEADAIEAYLGEDYEAIVEEYKFSGSGFKADVDFTYDAYAEDPHFFYAWDGEKFVDLEGKFNDDWCLFNQPTPVFYYYRFESFIQIIVG